MDNPFIADNFEPPRCFESNHFHFRVLEEQVAEQDFEAVTSSQKRLQGIFGPSSDWPRSDLTLAQNRLSLQVHKREFDSREAFAYSVFNKAKDKCLGSIYIDPSCSANYDSEVHLWIRDDCIELDAVLYQTVIEWLADSWPFSRVAFPGRGI
ncbi:MULTISPECIES: hypothetical protein [unclassified Shewanella]|uniref:hypothetical protein n=1 Tax=unclassified Shewanella TaxID=196818 RepID=UPI001BC78322|nr:MULTISPECIES: hypothetical protein [unclassified Shewanella]GIU06907.1 hypothetical protein TUM4444_05550 [Shewanella sp. MBTL60-112-B1]GIU26200.1 hypothetical protein TUM4445_05110 [Shewanella sp. MBTL60-112-B2]